MAFGAADVLLIRNRDRISRWWVDQLLDDVEAVGSQVAGGLHDASFIAIPGKP